MKMDDSESHYSKKKSKKDKDRSKHKKHKKEKKAKKKSRKPSSSSSSGSEDNEQQWVERVPMPNSSVESTKPLSVSSNEGSQQRDEWMSAPIMFACVTRDQLRAAKQPSEKKKAEEAAKYMLDRPGQSGRELNPYWAQNGTGLPSEKPVQPESLSLNSTTVGDQGVNWLRRALKRAQEQAEESGRSLEEVAAERWGSLEKLEQLLSEAEGRKVSLSDRRSEGRRNDRHRDRTYDRKQGSRHEKTYGKHQYDEDRRSSKSSQDFIDRTQDKQQDSDRRQQMYKSKEQYENRRDLEVEYDNKKSFRDGTSNYKDQRTRIGFMKPRETDEESKSSEKYNLGSNKNRNWRRKDVPSKVEEKEDASEFSTSQAAEPEFPSSSRPESPHPNLSTSVQEVLVLTDQQMNELAAKLVKAEIMGNEDLVSELKKKLELARQTRAANPTAVTSGPASKKTESNVVILSRTDSQGFARPLQTKSVHPEPSGGRRKSQKAETHAADGQRVRYFPDDDKYSLQDMFQREKLTTVEDQNEMFAKLAGKDGRQEHDLDMDDIFSERARVKESDGKVEARERGRAIQEHKRKERMLDGCKWCFDSKELQRHLIVAVGAKSYVCLPPHQSLTEGHCLIIPLHHTTCATQLDEDVWEEIQDFRKALVRMFAAEDEDCVLFESAMYLNKFPHMVLHCVPLPRETGDMAPIYFKKAILECEMEWSTNKKLVDLSKKDVRHSIPKGLPYFSVDFGSEGGFAHVIEDEKQFPSNFAQEIIGGMMDLDHSVWRKPRYENFDKQRRKVMAFSKKWRDFDFTKKSSDTKRMKTEEPDSCGSSSS